MTALAIAQRPEAIANQAGDPAFRALATSTEGEANGIRYEIAGVAGGPVVAVLGGISATRHVTSSTSDQRRGWWDDVVGEDRAIDTRRFRVLSSD